MPGKRLEKQQSIGRKYVALSQTFTCVDCGITSPVQTNGGTGYARYDGEKICYACCALRDAQATQEHGKITLYLDKKDEKYIITNWPGTLTFSPCAWTQGKHNMARTQTHVWFWVCETASTSYLWHGVQHGDFSQLCHCKRTKKVQHHAATTKNP